MYVYVNTRVAVFVKIRIQEYVENASITWLNKRTECTLGAGAMLVGICMHILGNERERNKAIAVS